MTERKCFVFKFADIEVREREFLLIKAGERIPVEPKAFRVLLFLLRNPGRLISKDEIVGNVWSDSVVSDNSLTRSIAQLRRVLGDDSREPLYILTVPTVGYRFLSEVSSTEDGFGLGSASSRLQANGTSTEQFSEASGLDDPESLDQSTTKGALPLDPEMNPPEVPGSATIRSRRMRLAGLGAATLLILFTGFLIRWAIARKSVPDSHAVTYRLLEQRVTSNPSEDPIRGALVSPDGKYVAYADPTGFYLRQMSTGETRPWSLPKGFVAWPNSWFPDSTHLLAVRIEKRTQGPDIWKPSLYKISILGGDPQKIMDDAAAGAVSPDGSHIAYLPGPKIASELWVMDSDGANARKVIAAGRLDKPGSHGSWFYPPVWSPDAKRLAYIEGHVVVGSDPREPGASLITIRADGGEPIGVLNDSRVGQALWWAQDGRILFAYHQDPDSKKNDDGVYSIRIDGRTREAVGAPQQLTRAEGGIKGLSATADGKRLILWRSNELLETFIARYDARTHVFRETRRLTLDESENFASAWTADSRTVLFVSNRNGTWKLFKQGIDEITPEALVEAPNIVLPRLSPDGSQVIYLTTPRPDASSLPTLMGKPLAGGPPHLIVQEEGIVNYGCARAPSKRCIYSKLTGKNLTFISFDAGGGKGQELSTIRTDLRNWVISPDGLKLAIVLDEHRVRFLSLDTGVANDVNVKDWLLNSVDWSADGRRVFMPSVDTKGIPVILEVDQTGRARVALQGTAAGEFGAMIQSPDGQYGLLLAVAPAQTNAWMVDNF